MNPPRFLAACAGLTLSLAATISNASAADSLVADITRDNDAVQLATFQHDRKTMDRFLAKDFILVLNAGAIVDRAGWLDGVADPELRWEKNATESLTVHQYNGDCALAIGILHLRYRVKNALTDVRLRFVDVWVKQDGDWKWASSQVAHLKPAAK